MLSRREMMNDEIVSEQGKNLVLRKCKGSYLHGMKVYGHTTQQTTTGAQLFDKSTITVHSYINDLDGSVKIVADPASGQYSRNSSDFIDVSGIENVYISVGVDTGNWGAFYDSDKNFVSGINGYGRPCAVPETAHYARFTVDDNIVDKFMINAGTAALPWEPYTGGKPSPNPDYPQELVSAGDKRSVEVEVAGKNLISPDNILYNANYWEYADGKWSTTNSNGTYVYQDLYLRKGTYTLSVDCESILNETGKLNFRKNNIIIAIFYFSDSGRKSLSCKITEDAVYRVLFGGSNENGALIFSKPQLEYKDQATDYEPYRTTQTLTILTPGGLPGIPVSSGGNYTDENGQQWIADEIDWGRGVYVQRVQEKNDLVFILHPNYSIEDSELFASSVPVSNIILEYNKIKCWCNRMSYNKTVAYTYDIGFYLLNRTIYARIPSVMDAETFNNLMEGARFIVPIQPIETPIPADELAAYRALHTNYPNTTVYNDEDCWMEVTHRRLRG